MRYTTNIMDDAGDRVVIHAPSHRAARSELAGMLRVSGPRGITAVADSGAVVHVELYDGRDWTVTASGQVRDAGHNVTTEQARRSAETARQDAGVWR